MDLSSKHALYPSKRHKKKQIMCISLGCSRNLVDTEVMLGTLMQKGLYENTTELKKADALIINTCGFLEAARLESLETIQNTLAQKKPGAKVIVTGCMTHIDKERIERDCPGVHGFLGAGDIEALTDILESPSPLSILSEKRSFLENNTTPRLLSTPPHYAYLKIAEGCRKRCSYCIIPTIKGPLKSKPLEQILHEAAFLQQQGVREIILIAQDLGDWGKDLGYTSSTGLYKLLQALIQQPGQARFRLLYLYPDEVSEDLIQLIRDSERIIPYLDMPIQHINDDILKKMYRSTTKQMILSVIENIRAQIPTISLRTSLIVGFPSETDLQFQELCHFLEEYQLDNVGIFAYSPEALSPSATFSDQIPEQTIRQRVTKLSTIQKRISMAKNRAYVGKTIAVTVDGFHPESRYLLIGRHDGQCPDVDGAVIINDAQKIEAFGERYLVAISDAFEYDLIGQPLKKEKNR